MSTVQNGNTVTLHYTGILNDGTQFDSSEGKEPLMFQVGSGQVIPGFNDGVIGMNIGETKTIVVPHQDAYGPKIDDAIQVVQKEKFPPDFEIRVGETVAGQTQDGHGFNAVILSEQTDTVTLDFNHPLAGEDLTFEVKLMSVT